MGGNKEHDLPRFTIRISNFLESSLEGRRCCSAELGLPDDAATVVDDTEAEG